jgi:hypothetical protein
MSPRRAAATVVVVVVADLAAATVVADLEAAASDVAAAAVFMPEGWVAAGSVLPRSVEAISARPRLAAADFVQPHLAPEFEQPRLPQAEFEAAHFTTADSATGFTGFMGEDSRSSVPG